MAPYVCMGVDTNRKNHMLLREIMVLKVLDLLDEEILTADPAWVQRVHLHPLRFGNGCNAPVQKRTESLQNWPICSCRFNQAMIESSSKFERP